MISVVRLVPWVLLLKSLCEGPVIDVSLGLHGDLLDLSGGLLNILYHHLQYLLRYPLCFDPLWMTAIIRAEIIKSLALRQLFDHLRYIIFLISTLLVRILPVLGLSGWSWDQPRKTEISVYFWLCELFFDLKLEIHELQLDALIDVSLTTEDGSTSEGHIVAISWTALHGSLSHIKVREV